MMQNIQFGPWKEILNQNLKEISYTSLFFIVDQRLDHLHNLNIQQKKVVVEAAEENKELETIRWIWEEMSASHCDRNTIVVCMGGGYTTDVGGFAASAYMRGLRTIYIPSTILGMVDAAIGGKTGINFFQFKNRIGSFHHPEHIIIDTGFLQSLPEKEWWSGYAELVKHALIADKELWQEVRKISVFDDLKKNLSKTLERAIEIKKEIVNRDFKEKGERKKLNFGHTAGHALESLLLRKDNKISHGHAIAIGMQIETDLSVRAGNLDREASIEIIRYLRAIYDPVEAGADDLDELFHYMSGDKKNSGPLIHFTLLNAIGEAVVGQSPPIEAIELCWQSYIDDYKNFNFTDNIKP